MVTYPRAVDEVFRALADPTRRALLDELFRQDGQTLRSWRQRFPMSRFGVMKHLRCWKKRASSSRAGGAARSCTSSIPVPIRLVHDRWVSKYSEPWVAALSDLKNELERTMEKVYEIYIRTTPERLWQALTSPEDRPQFQFGAGRQLGLEVGSRIEIVQPQGGVPAR